MLWGPNPAHKHFNVITYYCYTSSSPCQGQRDWTCVPNVDDYDDQHYHGLLNMIMLCLWRENNNDRSRRMNKYQNQVQEWVVCTPAGASFIWLARMFPFPQPLPFMTLGCWPMPNTRWLVVDKENHVISGYPGLNAPTQPGSQLVSQWGTYRVRCYSCCCSFGDDAREALGYCFHSTIYIQSDVPVRPWRNGWLVGLWANQGSQHSTPGFDGDGCDCEFQLFRILLLVRCCCLVFVLFRFRDFIE